MARPEPSNLDGSLALRLAEELVENLPVGTYIISFSPDLQTYISPVAERMLGYPRGLWDESLSFLETILHPDDRERILDNARRMLVGEIDADRTEYRVIAADGRVVWVYGAVDLVRDAEGKPLYMRGCYIDITERKQLEEQLHLSQRMEMIGQLAGGIAHDFNNLLTAITGYAGLAHSAIADEPEELRRPIDRIEEAAERAADLTGQLLAFSRRQMLQPQPLELGEVVEQTLLLLERTLGERIELRTAHPEKPVSVIADPARVEQVIVNLALNARDAMPDGGELWIETGHRQVGADSTIAAWGAPPGKYATLVVRDCGCGMAADTVVHAFEPFFTTKEVGTGTGLGLSTVYGIVKQSGGWITIDSEPGAGTTATIYLPIQQAPASAGTEAPERIRSGRAAGRILLVEDEATVRELTGEMLERGGYDVIEAEGPGEALELAELQDFDLVVTDVVMPKMNGCELVRRIRERLPGLTVVFMSGYMPESVLDGLGPGEHFLQKPFTMRVLTDTVREALGDVTALA